MPVHVDLDRKFAPIVADPDDRDPEFAVHLASLNAETWQQLLAHQYVVVLGEAGAGKTAELRWRTAKLNETGIAAFFVPIERLATDGLLKAIGPATMERVSGWLATQDEAVFLLDSLDEAKLAARTLADALTNFAAVVGKNLARARLIISCRVSDWRPADQLAASEIIGREAHADKEKPPAIFVVGLVPLDLNRVRTLAIHLKVADADLFLQAIDQANAQAFAARPQDVEWLVGFWNRNRRLGSLEELIDDTVRIKLLEKPDRPAALSFNDAFSGAKRLAGVSLIAGRRSFTVPGVPLDVQRATSANPAEILPDWTPDHLRALLTLPLFDEASYGRVRIHHRAVHEYLAARWLLDLLEEGLPRKQLNGLLFREVAGQRLVPAYLSAAMAWLSLWDDNVRELATSICPEHLLDEGDPNGLPEPARVKILRGYAGRYKDRGELFHSFDRAGLGRFGSAALAGPINELLISKPAEELQSMLLQLVAEARLENSIPIALSIAVDPKDNTRSRQMAIRAVGQVGTNADRRTMTELILAETPLAAEIAGSLVLAAFPHALSVDQLTTIVENVGDDSEDHRTTLSYVLEFEVPGQSTAAMREHLLLGFKRIAFEHDSEGKGALRLGRKWLLRPIANLLVAHFNDPECCPLTENVIESMKYLRACLEKGDANFAVLDLKKKLAERPDIRRQLFWSRAEEHFCLTKKRPRRYFEIFDYYRLFDIGSADEAWLMEDAKAKATSQERVLAFDALVRTRPQNARDDEWESSIKSITSADVALRKRYERSLRVPPANPQTKKHERVMKALDLRRAREARESAAELTKHLDEISAGSNFSALVYLHQQSSKDHQVLGEVVVSKLEEAFGAAIARAAESGFRAYWKTYCVRLPYERRGSNALPWHVILGLAGINLDVACGLEPSALPDDTLEQAIRLAAWELNGFPGWMTTVAVKRPQNVTRVYERAIEHEYVASNPGQGRADFLDKLTRSSPELRRACLATIKDMLKTREPGTPETIEAAVNCVLLQDAMDPELESIFEQRCVASSKQPDRFAVWWCAWSQRNAIHAVEFLETYLATAAAELADELVFKIVVQLWQWCEPHSTVLPALRKEPRALRKFTPLVYAHIRSIEDLQHVGAHWVSPRDEAQHLRDRLFEWLATCEPSEARKALLELAADTRMKGWRDILLNAVHRVAVSSLLPLPIADAINWAVKGFAPASAEDLFRVALDRLDDIRLEDIDTGDFSYSDLFTKTDATILEVPVQKWLASRLRDSSRRQYTVIREEEVANKKKPDIRLHRNAVRSPVSIEIKIADRWDLSQLVDSLKVQIVSQYLVAVHSNFAILLLFHVGRRKAWTAEDGKKLSFAEVVEHLRSVAITLVDGNQVRRLEIVVFDAAR
jgi:hypothetical protein